MTTSEREHRPWVHWPTIWVLFGIPVGICTLGVATLLAMMCIPFRMLCLGSVLGALLLVASWMVMRRRRVSRWSRWSVAALAGYFGMFAVSFNFLGWKTVCTAASPEGLRAVVECHTPSLMPLARSHYYLFVEPSRMLRPQAGKSTLKSGGSFNKPREFVRQEWAERHFLGYLQPEDGTDRAPNRIEWTGDLLTVHSHEGLVGRFDVRAP